jgi:endonuclease/exonuclease/phosphatase family metal-dependent hydrolase
MRIVSYNILEGGEGRADPLAEVIEAQQPDLVALVEATDLNVIERIARRLGMDFVHAPGNTKASALLSRWTIRESINHALLHPELSKSLLEATVVDQAGQEWTLGVVHFHAHATEKDEARRDAELRIVLDVFAPHRSAHRRHLICGDFNSNSSTQRIDPDRCKPSTRREWTENGGAIPRRIIQAMLEQRYVDTLHALRGDFADTHGTFSTQFPGQRVDYIFSHGVPAERLKDAWIEYDRLAKYASDHFPIGLEIG